MGLILNPIAYRVGFTKSWADTWFVHRINYPVFLHSIINFKIIFNFCFLRGLNFKNKKLVYSHSRFFFFRNKLFITMYFYNSYKSPVYNRFRFLFERGVFKKIQLPTFWLKKTIFDKRYFAQRLVWLMYFMRFKFFNLYLSGKKKLNFKLDRKLKYLKKKYSTKQKSWFGKEELKFYLNWVYWLCFSQSRLGLMFFYQSFIYRFKKRKNKHVRKFKYLKNGRIFYKINKRKKKDFRLKNGYKSHYIKLIFFLSIMYRMLTGRGKDRNTFFMQRNLVRFFYFFANTFFFRPMLTQIKKFAIWLSLMFNFNTKISLCLVKNIHLTSAFLARYVIYALKSGYKLYDFIIPIQKNLSSQMYRRKLKKLNVNKAYFTSRSEAVFRSLEFLSIFFYFIRQKRLIYIYMLLNSIILKKKFLYFNKYKRPFFYFKLNLKRGLNLKKSLNLKKKLKLKKKYINMPFVFELKKMNNTFKYKYKIKKKILNIKYFNIFNFFFFKKQSIFKYGLIFNRLNIKYTLFLLKKYLLLLNLNLCNIVKHFFSNNKIFLVFKIFFFELFELCFKKFFYYSYIQNKFFIFNFSFKIKNVFIFFGFDLYKIKFFDVINKKKFNLKNFKILLYLRFFLFFKILIIKSYFKFFVKLKLLKNYLFYLKNKKFVLKKTVPIVKNIVPLNQKEKRLLILDNNKALLYGYKFHFVGRFTRKQRSANLWFLKGSLYNSAINYHVDYSITTIPLKFSACTIKIWLFRNKKLPKCYFKIT